MDLLRNRLCAFDSGFREEEEKLLSAPAGADILTADRTPENVGDFDQEFVAGVETVSVIDPLETVDVGEDDGKGPLVALRTAELLLDLSQDIAAIRQPRHDVDSGGQIKRAAHFDELDLDPLVLYGHVIRLARNLFVLFVQQGEFRKEGIACELSAGDYFLVTARLLIIPDSFCPAGTCHISSR